MRVFIKKNAWYCRLQKRIFPRDELPNSLCPFFWKTILALLIAPFELLVSIIFNLFVKIMDVVDYLLKDNYLEPWSYNPNFEQFKYMMYYLERDSNDISQRKIEHYRAVIDANFEKYRKEFHPSIQPGSFRLEMNVLGRKLYKAPKYWSKTHFRKFTKFFALFSLFVLLVGTLALLMIHGPIVNFYSVWGIGLLLGFLIVNIFIWLPYFKDQSESESIFEKIIHFIFKLGNAVGDLASLVWKFMSATGKRICPVIEWEDE